MKHGDSVRSKRHNHDELMTYCCRRPGTKEFAIVIRSDGRLSEIPVKDLEKAKGD